MSDDRQFSLVSVREAQRVILRAYGRLVLGHGADEPLWAPHLNRSGSLDVALDLAGVTDIDARGLGLLMSVTRCGRRRGMTLSVTAASRVVQHLAEVTHLTRVLPGRWHEGRSRA